MTDQPIEATGAISVVVPVYNSEGSLRPLTERLHAVLAELATEHEIILVNDGSRDDSWGVITELASADPAIRGIDLMRNFGQHNALLCGIRAARHDLIVTIDDDLQHPPEEIRTLLAKLREGFDVVYGTPGHEQHGLWRDLASVFTKLALRAAMGVEVAGKVSAFRVFRTRVRGAFESYDGPFVSIDVLLTWGTTRFASVVTRHEPRAIGASNYTFGKLTAHALNMMTGYSAIPLQVASLIGFVFTLFGMAVLAWVLGRLFFQGVSVPGFAFLASTIAIFSGAQLFSIGIIGEYLARMHFRTMNKPSYVLRGGTNDDSEGSVEKPALT